jgi:hypothetical protein
LTSNEIFYSVSPVFTARSEHKVKSLKRLLPLGRLGFTACDQNRTDPLGTPDLTGTLPDVSPSSITACVRFDQKLCIDVLVLLHND